MSQVSQSKSLENIILPGAEHSRRLFIRRSAAMALMGTTAAALLSSPTLVQAAKGRQSEKYGNQGDNFDAIRTHENNHVNFLVTALGADARPKPTFQKIKQDNLVDFINTSQALENTGVGAYLGAAPSIDNKDYLAAAGTIAFIEARHAGYLNVLVDDPITGDILDLTANNSFETPLTADQVVDQAEKFIADLNGGPPLTYSTTPSKKNDIAILNFALALEYLEAEFYNKNVRTFFPG